MIRSLQTLFSELQMQEKAGPIPRLWHLASVLSGSFRRRLPVIEMTPQEYFQILKPDVPHTLQEYIDDREHRALPWKNIPLDLIPDVITFAADKISRKEFTFHGCSHQFPDEVNWHLAFPTNKAWPKNHWSEILFRRTYRLGDVKVCWEMNRHQFFTMLGLAFRKTKSPTYDTAFVNLINTWCDQNPPEIGVNYVSCLEIGIRCISWIYADRLFRDSIAYDKKTRLRLHTFIYSQARHVAEYLSDRDKTGRDHRLIGAAASLAFIALNYPEWKDSDKWYKEALDVLWPAFEEQILTDGMHFEASFGYQLLVAEFMLLLLAEMRRLKKPVPPKAHVLLEKMVTVLRLARTPDNDLPNINDNDDGTAMPLPLLTPFRLQGVFAVGALLYDRPDFKAACKGKYNLYSFLILGEAGQGEMKFIPEYEEDLPLLTQFKDSHLYVIRNKNDYALLKNNPDPAPKSGHNHADLLHIVMILNGKHVLVDTGSFRFHGDGGYRNALRSTTAHNTITVDLKNQAEPEGNFSWSSEVKSGFGDVFENADFALIDASHDSYSRFAVSHRRVLVWLKQEETFLVIDQLRGQKTHYFEQNWHFPPGSRAEEYKPLQCRLFDANGLLAHIRFCGDEDYDQYDLLAGSDRNKSYSFSKKYGEIESAPALKHSWKSTLEFGHNSYRMTVFSKDLSREEWKHLEHAVFQFGSWHIDLNHVPVKIVKKQ